MGISKQISFLIKTTGYLQSRWRRINVFILFKILNIGFCFSTVSVVGMCVSVATQKLIIQTKPSSQKTSQASRGTYTDMSVKRPLTLLETSALVVWDKRQARWASPYSTLCYCVNAHLQVFMPSFKSVCTCPPSVRPSVHRHQPWDPVPVIDWTMETVPSQSTDLSYRRSQEFLSEVSS